MARTATTLLVLGLLAGTAIAFAVSEGLKLEKSPITRTRVDKVFSPVCACPTARARIEFRLRRADGVSLQIVDRNGDGVRTLVRGRRFSQGLHRFTWNGRDDAGRLVPEAAYRPRVALSAAGRTIVLPSPIRVDVTPPRVRVLDVRPHLLSPDGNGRSDVLRVRYRLSERARALLLVDGVVRVRKRLRPLVGDLAWYGKAGGSALAPGTYRLAVQAVDPAGNVSRAVPAGTVRLVAGAG